MNKKNKILITGVAGFIGFHLAMKYLRSGISVVGIDNLNTYYNPKLKKARLREIFKHIKNKKNNAKFIFLKQSLENKNKLKNCFKKFKFKTVINLAAQAGVRYSIKNPHSYIDRNILGFLNILECCRNHKVKHLIYASTSSVYGLDKNFPLKETRGANHPVQLYAATKRANELMAHSYSHLFKIPTTGIRFFTVYGPWGRPDMALNIFTKNIVMGKPIKIFNKGNHLRDFTYIDDVVEAIFRLSQKKPKKNKNWNAKNPDPSSSNSPFEIYNLGGNNSEKLLRFVHEIEKNLKRKAIKRYLPLQPGDIVKTQADNSKLYKKINFKPRVKISTGIKYFVRWYLSYYK